jgi:hypothetical protein
MNGDKKPGSGWYFAAIRQPGFSLFQCGPHYLLPLQPLAPAGFSAGASCVAGVFSNSVLPAPGLSPVHDVVAQPVTEIPAPASKPAMLKPARSFFRSFLSISTSLSFD